jgi:hypothetical protein
VLVERIDQLFTRQGLLLAAIITLGGALRFSGLSFGLPFAHSRPDETALAGPAVMCLIGQCAPIDFYYPSGFVYALTVVYLAIFAVLRARGTYADRVSFAESRRVDVSTFFMTSRALSAIAGTATIYVVFALGRQLWNPGSGLVSALYLAVCLLHVRDSHFGTTDVTMTALITLTVLCIVKWQQMPSHRLAALSGIVGGAAASTKYNGLGAGLPFAVAAGLQIWTGPVLTRVNLKKVAIAAVLAAAAGLLTFLLLSPYVVIDWPRFVRDITTRGDGLARPHGVDVGPGWRHHAMVTLPGAFGWPLYLWSVAGVIGLLATRFRHSLVLLSFPLAYYVVIGSLDTVFARYALPLVPFLALTAGWMTMVAGRFVSLRLRVASPGAVAAVLAVWLAAPSGLEAVRLDRILSRPDTRMLAAGYLQRHTAPGDSIYLSGTAFVHTPLGLAGTRVAAEPRAADARGFFAVGGSGVEELPTWIVLHRSPLTVYSPIPDRIDGITRTRYSRVARFDATDPGHRGLYDQQDALFLPLRGLRGVRHIGPTVEIFRRNAD